MESKVISRTSQYLRKNFSNALYELSEGPKEVKPLSIERINNLHEEMIEYFGGSAEVRDANLLESLSVNPFQDIFGQELYPTVFEKAAKYMLDFSRYQVYVDGNKRMGLAVAEAFLEDQGMELTFTEEQACNLVMDIANHRIDDVKQIAQTIKENYGFISLEEELEL